MDPNIVAGLFGVVGTIIGTILGWWLNSLSLKREKKPRLCYILSATQDQDMLTPVEQRDKYSESGYGIEIYNVGREPVVIDQMCLCYKKQIIADALIVYQVLRPYEKTVYELDEQEFDNIKYHCRKRDIKKCDVVTRNVTGKNIKGKLDIGWVNMVLSLRDSIPMSG